VALSDMARAAAPGDAAAAAQHLLGAAAKYATSLKWNPNNPQARAPAAAGPSERRSCLPLELVPVPGPGWTDLRRRARRR